MNRIFDPAVAQPSVWQRLLRIHRLKRTGSAYLFSGPAGSGKEAMAIEFAKLINCEADSEQPCNQCPSCQRINVLQHENLSLVYPLPREGGSSGGDDPLKGLSEKTLTFINDSIQAKSRDPFHKISIPKANTIPISVVRDIRKHAYLKTPLKGCRFILIFDSHLLGTGEGASANALLKILEEPPEATSFILVTDKKNSLLPTILSRCQQIDFPPLNDDYIASQIEAENIGLVAGISSGNMHLARKISALSSADLHSRIEDMVRQILKKNGPRWRTFVNNFSRMAVSDRDEYRFNFYLLQVWFRAAYRQRVGVSDPLHENGLLPLMEQLNQAKPSIDYLGINQAIGAAIDALANNYYIPLTLTNFLTSIQRRMSGN